MKQRTKTGGRVKGSKNRITLPLRNAIQSFLESNTNEVFTIWDKLNPPEKLKFWSDLLRYAVPQLQSVDLRQELAKDIENLPESAIDEILNRIIELKKLQNG
jgi:hypothetical protein